MRQSVLAHVTIDLPHPGYRAILLLRASAQVCCVRTVVLGSVRRIPKRFIT